MKASDVTVGECYRTSANWVRQVVTIEEGKVRYRSRGRKDEPGWTSDGRLQFQSLALFAFDVVEVVPADWEPKA